jgi:hypothetical protein
MLRTTRAQRLALARIHARILSGDNPDWTLTYRCFRRTVLPGPGCIMVPFAGMVLGIEPDGYTHS